MGNRTTRTAAAAFVVGLSLAGPQALGVAAADSDQTDTATTSSASRGPAPARAAGPAQRNNRTARAATGTSARRDSVPAAARKPRVPGGAAVATPLPRRAQPPGPATVDLPAALSEAPSVARSAAAEGVFAPSVARAAPAAGPPARAQALGVAANPIQQILNDIGRWLSDQPVTPFTDVLSGGLWLARRTLITVTTALGGWGPSVCNCAPAGAGAQVLTVTSAVDGTAGSLRAVLATATSGAVIRFAPSLTHATLSLTLGELAVTTSVNIEGSGQTLDAGGLSRIMRLDVAGTSIALSGLTFANGAAPGDPAEATVGGAILARGVTLTVCGSTFTGNSAISPGPAQPGSDLAQSGLGGAIAAFDSTVTISDSVFTANTAVGGDNNVEQQAASGFGGAVAALDSDIVLLRSRFVGNTATGGSSETPIRPVPSSFGGGALGGAVYANGGALSATDVIFEGNAATGGDGLDGSASNPYGNVVGGGGSAAGGALWVEGKGKNPDFAVPLSLQQVQFVDNTATGGLAGAQGTADSGVAAGGNASGGALGAVSWLAITLADITFRDNLAQGGGAGDNAADAGALTSKGGIAVGGAALLESPASLDATRLSVRDNIARGGRGANSAPDSGSEAGEGGNAFGGGISLTNATGGSEVIAVVLPANIRDSEFVGNQVIGGTAGEGPVPASGLGAGGLASAGALDLVSLFAAQFIGVRFIDNSAIAGQGKFASAGALAKVYGESLGGEDAALLVLNSSFRDNTAIGGDDAANDVYRGSYAGAFLNNGTDTVVSGSRFRGNTVIGGNDTGSGHLGSASGGGIYSLGRNPSITIINTDFVRNSATGGLRLVAGESTEEPVSGEAHGGALSAENGRVTIIGGTVMHNAAVVRTAGVRVASGGAIDMPSLPEETVGYLSTSAVRFIDNAAVSVAGPADGGAVAFDQTRFTDNGSTFAFNIARSGCQTGAAYGGALYLKTDSQLNGTQVVGNRAWAAEGYGGGIALPLGQDVLTRVQTTVIGNRASTDGDNVWSADLT